MTKLKFSLLDVKLASRKQKRNEKRTHGECRLLNSPSSSTSSSSNTPNLAITLGVWTMTLRRMTLEYYNDDRRCKELLEIGWKAEYETLQNRKVSEENNGPGDVRKKLNFICYINFGFRFSSSKTEISFTWGNKIARKLKRGGPFSKWRNKWQQWVLLHTKIHISSSVPRRWPWIRKRLLVCCYDIVL